MFNMGEIDDLNYDLVSMREAKVNKYDLLCKHLVSLNGSNLASLLEVDRYEVASIEFAELFGERADAVYRRDNHVLHVEFQTKNDADLPWRMLEYYVRIMATHGDRKHPERLLVEQTILYIGTPRSTPQLELRTDNLAFSFGWQDIRSFHDRAAELLESELPDDWVLGVLCMRTVDDETWKRVAKQISRSRLSERAYRLARTKLLLVANLRRVEESLIKELIQMSALFNVGNSNALRGMVDEILNEGTSRSLLRATGRILSGAKVTISEHEADELTSLDQDGLEAFIAEFAQGKNVADALALARASGPGPT